MYSKNDSEKIKNKTKKAFDKIVKNLQNIVNNGDYENFLKFQKQFMNYSFNNIVLIFNQCPEATMVAGKTKWLQYKREVIENAKKIWILAPIPRRYQKKIKTIENDKEIEKLETIKYNLYKYVYVYDISQTKGEDIPLEDKDLNSNNIDKLYEKLIEFSPVKVIEKELTGGLKGYYREKAQEIAIKNNLSLDDKTAVLLHELTHCLYDDFDYSKNRDLSEVFVESVAYIVAEHFGLDTSLCSFRYIIKWANGEPKTVLELGQKIQNCANSFINELEKFNMKELKQVA